MQFFLKKTSFIIFLVLFIQIYLSYNVYIEASQFYANRISSGKTKPKVYDIAYKYLPDLKDNKFIEYSIDLLVILPILLIFLNKNFIKTELHNDYIIMLITLHLIRLIFINSTILPSTKDCYDKDKIYGIYNLIFGHCYDKIFSGHLSTSIITSIFLYNTGIIKNSLLLIGYNTLLSILLLLHRGHYTVDLLVAILASYFVYNVDNSLLHSVVFN